MPGSRSQRCSSISPSLSRGTTLHPTGLFLSLGIKNGGSLESASDFSSPGSPSSPADGEIPSAPRFLSWVRVAEAALHVAAPLLQSRMPPKGRKRKTGAGTSPAKAMASNGVETCGVDSSPKRLKKSVGLGPHVIIEHCKS